MVLLVIVLLRCALHKIFLQHIQIMKERRKEAHAKANNDGNNQAQLGGTTKPTELKTKKCKFSKEYKEDLTRGLSLARNELNHALYLEHSINKLKSKIGDNKYNDLFKKTCAAKHPKSCQESSLKGTYFRIIADFYFICQLCCCCL